MTTTAGGTSEESDTAFDTSANPEGIYDLVEPLGKGAFGVVYKALDKRDGEMVGLKIMPETADNGSLEEEVRIMKKCKSPYIVNFRHAFLYEKRIWLAMEYCGGGSLLDIMKVRGRCLSEKQIQVVMRETLKGIYYLHSKSIIHRDIKAGNILVNEKGMCKLADFGVSKKQSTMDKASTTIGSPYWMAPEVFTSESYTQAVDIWSLGCTCIELAIGKPPFSDLHPLKAILQIPKADPPRLPDGLPKDFSPDFKDFIAQCCIKDPKARPTAAHLFRNAWVRASKGLRVLQSLVTKAQPYLDAWRKEMRDEDIAEEQVDEAPEEDEEEEESEEDYGGTVVFSKKGGGGDADEEDEDDSDEAKAPPPKSASAVQSAYGSSKKSIGVPTKLSSKAMAEFDDMESFMAKLPITDFNDATKELNEQYDRDRAALEKWYKDARARVHTKMRTMG